MLPRPVVIAEKEEQLFPGEKVAWCTDKYSLCSLDMWYNGPVPVSMLRHHKHPAVAAARGAVIR